MSYLNSTSKHADHKHCDTEILGENVPPWFQDPVLGVLFGGNVPELIHRDHLENSLPVGQERQVSNTAISPQGVSITDTDVARIMR